MNFTANRYINSSFFFTSGSIGFVNTELHISENDSSAEVCVRARGYGFVVNVSTVELSAIGIPLGSCDRSL